MCSTFMHKTPYNCAYSKSQYEAPKQLLQLRSSLKPLLADSCYSSDESSCSPSSPRSSHPPKHLLQYIEPSRRALGAPKMQNYQAFDLPLHHQRKAPLMRTPSSGFSSSSSSENMFSALSINSNEQKMREIMDPSVEVDLDMFLQPDVRYNKPSSSASRQPAPQQQKKGSAILSNPYGDYSYSNVKRSSGYTDFLASMPPQQPSSSSSMAAAATSTISVPMSPNNSWIRCHYCWETYVKLCQRVANQDPLVKCDGPWQWHNLYDAQGRVTCPRLWFTQLDRAGNDMIQQMGHRQGVRHAPV